MSRPPTIFAETPKQARRMMSELYSEAYLNGKIVGIDSEFVPITNEPVLVSFSWGRGIRRVVRAELFKEVFGEWVIDPQTKLAYQNYKADVETFEMLGISASDLVKSFYIDTMVAGVLRDETLLHHGLKAQMRHWLDWFRREYGQLFCYVPPGMKKPIILDPRQVMDDLPPNALLGAVKKWGSSKGGHKTGPRSREEWIQTILDYAGDDAEGTAILAKDHRSYLRKTNYWDTYCRVDRLFTTTLMRCEDAGVMLNIPRLHEILRKQEIRIMRAEHCFRTASGNPKLNLRSGPQMRALLIDEWDWPVNPEMVGDKSGEASLDKEAMTWWAREHNLEMAEVKLAFNNANTMRGTFLKGLIEGVGDDGRLRSDLNQIGAKRMGRISSRKIEVMVEETRTLKNGTTKTSIKKKKVGANLQNIPARKEKDPDGIRRAFRAPLHGEVAWDGKPADGDHTLVVCDYSGFHWVLVIHWISLRTGSSKMLDVMTQRGSPSAVHAYTAINMFENTIHRCDSTCAALGKPHRQNKSIRLGDLPMDDWKLAKKIFPDQYTYAKNTTFGLIFLGSPWTLARNTGRDPRNPDHLREAEAHYEKWHSTYPEIKTEYQQPMIDHGYEHGWVPTIAGRRIHVDSLLRGEDSSGRFIKDEKKRKNSVQHGESICTNGPAQGSESDIVKEAMNLLSQSEFLHDRRAAPLFPVHDEVLVEAPLIHGQEVLDEQIRLMKLPYRNKMKFELSVEGAFGIDWATAKP